MGAEGAVSGAAGSAAVSSAGAAGAADAAGSSFTLWLGADGCAADAAVLSASEDAESFFGVSVLFSSFPFWCCGPHRSHSPTAEPTAPPSGPQAGTPAGLWCQNRPPRWQAPSPPRPPSGPPHGAIFFFGVPVSFCLIPLALPPSCILTRPLAAKSASNAIYTSIVYTQPQAPVNVLRCLMQGVSWKFSTTADVPCGKRTKPPYYCIQKKKR